MMAGWPGSTKPISSLVTSASTSMAASSGTTAHQGLRAGHDLADRGDAELLHGAGDRRPKLHAFALRLRLDQFLFRPLGLAFGVREFFGLLGDELRHLLDELAFGRERRLGFPELSLLVDQRGFLGFQLLLRVEHERPGTGAAILELLTHVDALGMERDHPLAGRDAVGQPLPFRLLLFRLGLQAALRGRQFGNIGGEHAVLANLHRSVVPASERDRRRRKLVRQRDRHRETAARRFRGRAFEVAQLCFAIRGGVGRIKLDQRIAGLDGAAVLDEHLDHPAGFEGLHHLGSADRLNPTGRDRLDVELAEIGPGERRRGGNADKPQESDADRVTPAFR